MMGGPNLEFRGFRRIDSATWHRRVAKQKLHRRHESRTDIYVVLPDPTLNVKLRWGHKLEVKKLEGVVGAGVEAWTRALSVPLQQRGQSVDDIEGLLLAGADRHSVMHEVGRSLAIERAAGRPAPLVHVDKLRKRLSGAGTAERTTMRITIGSDVLYFESHCVEGSDPRARSAKLTTAIDTSDHVGAYSSFLQWLLLNNRKTT